MALLELLPDLSLQKSVGSLNPDQIRTIMALSAIIGYLSLIGTAFNLVSTVLIKSSSKLMDNMIITLSVLDLINGSVTPFLPMEVSENWACQFQNFIMYFGYGGSLTMTCCIAHSLYITVKHDFRSTFERMFRKYLIWSISVAMFTSLSSVITQYRQLNSVTHTCGHAPLPGQFDIGAFLVLLLPSIVSLSYCLFCYATVLKRLREANQKIYTVLLLYPAILVITNLPTTMNRICSQLDAGFQQPFAWTVICTMLIASRGLLNAFAYGLSRRIIEGYKRKCCHRRKSYTDETTAAVDSDSYSIIEGGKASMISQSMIDYSDYETDKSVN